MLATTLSLAVEAKMFITTVSAHHNYDKEEPYDYNNANFGVGFELTYDTGFGLQVGSYWNSYEVPTMFVGIHYQYELLKDLYASGAISLATGYEEHLGHRLLPIPTIGIQYKFIRIVTTAPFASVAKKVGVTNLQLVFKF